MFLTLKHNYGWDSDGEIDNSSPKPFCECCKINSRKQRTKRKNKTQNQNNCSCGEEVDVAEWRWEGPTTSTTSWVMLCPDRRQVIFHPYYSSGTAAVRGNTSLEHNSQYYWELKMMSDTYGTDIMVGVGTDKVKISQFKFVSLLGQDAESYGFSYTGAVRHDGLVARESVGFCRGSIVGVRVDMWMGTLEFYVNRKPQGPIFFNLRRHDILFPMICSTAAQSCMRLTYAGSWKASLLVDASRILAASVKYNENALPPGLRNHMKSNFWLLLPSNVEHDLVTLTPKCLMTHYTCG